MRKNLEAVSQSQQTCDQSSILNIHWHSFSPFLPSEFRLSFFWYFIEYFSWIVYFFCLFLSFLLAFAVWIYTFTENNKVFFNGKSIFALNETFKNRFRNSETAAHCVIRHNYELIDFQKRCLDDQGNLDDLVDIVAGKTHFVVLTSKFVPSINCEQSINQLTGDIVLFIYSNFLYWIRFNSLEIYVALKTVENCISMALWMDRKWSVTKTSQNRNVLVSIWWPESQSVALHSLYL